MLACNPRFDLHANNVHGSIDTHMLAISSLHFLNIRKFIDTDLLLKSIIGLRANEFAVKHELGKRQ